MRPKVSVVIPVYNRAHSVLPTLQSVQAQTMPDFECIVVDDGSSDGTELRDVVQALADARFRYVRRENGGGGAARNTGIDEAKADIVAFLDSDDRWLPEKLGAQLRQLGAGDDKAIYTAAYVDRGVSARWVRPSRGLRPDEDVAEYLFVANEFIQSSTIALATSVARRVRWDPALQRGQDLDFVLNLQRAGIRFEYCAVPLVIWRDEAAHGRTSQVRGAIHAYALLTKHQDTMSRKAIRGFRATYLANDLSAEHPLLAFRYLLGGLAGGVSPMIVGRQALRCFLPKSAYRKMVDRFVAVAGE